MAIRKKPPASARKRATDADEPSAPDAIGTVLSVVGILVNILLRVA